IATRTTGFQICELMPRLATFTDRCCFIRSMTHQDANHTGAVHVCLTGSSKVTEKTLTEQPHLGSVMAKVRPATRNVPSYVWLQDLDADARTYYLHGGILGETYAPMLVGKRLDNPSAPRFRMTAFDPQPDVAAGRLRQRYELLQTMQANPRQT